MDETIKLLSDPITFGLVISTLWEGTPFFQDDNKSPYAKIGLVALSCLIWSVLVASMSATGLPTTLSGWQPVLLMAAAVTASTQVVHIVIHKAFPWLGAFLDKLPGLIGTSTQPPTTPPTQKETNIVG